MDYEDPQGAPVCVDIAERTQGGMAPPSLQPVSVRLPIRLRALCMPVMPVTPVTLSLLTFQPLQAFLLVPTYLVFLRIRGYRYRHHAWVS